MRRSLQSMARPAFLIGLLSRKDNRACRVGRMHFAKRLIDLVGPFASRGALGGDRLDAAGHATMIAYL